jgi:hypothetical protein
MTSVPGRSSRCSLVSSSETMARDECRVMVKGVKESSGGRASWSWWKDSEWTWIHLPNTRDADEILYKAISKALISNPAIAS